MNRQAAQREQCPIPTARPAATPTARQTPLTRYHCSASITLGWPPRISEAETEAGSNRTSRQGSQRVHAGTV